MCSALAAVSEASWQSPLRLGSYVPLLLQCLAADEAAPVRVAASRTLGVFACFALTRGAELGRAMLPPLLRCAADPTVALRERASWAIANLVHVR